MQGCHSRVARRLVGVGSQMASIRSASIGPFGSFTTSGEGLKLPVSEFHPHLASILPLPFLAALVHSGFAKVKPRPARHRRLRALGDTKKMEWWPGRNRTTNLAGDLGEKFVHALEWVRKMIGA
jgi:hypothetical protein